MSDPRNIARRLEQTQVVERPGGVTGHDIFYEASTYTPTYTGATTAGVTTYSVQAGFWVRLGKVAIVTGTVGWTAATGTGDVNVSLPFTAENVANQNFSLSLRNTGVTFAAGTPQGQILPNTAFFTLQSPVTNGGSTPVAIEAAGTIIFTATYFIV